MLRSTRRLLSTMLQHFRAVAIGAAVVFRPVYQRSVLLTVVFGVSLDVVDDVAGHRVVRSVVVFVVT